MKLLALITLGLWTLTGAVTHPLEGKWLGSIDTDRGTMQIELDVHDADGKPSGAVKTPHGDWPITSLAEDKGAYTVVFNNGDGTGKLVGRIDGTRFTGTWDNSPYATGTFELTKR